MTLPLLGKQCGTCARLTGYETDGTDNQGLPINGRWVCSAFPKRTPEKYQRDEQTCPKRTALQRR